MNYLIKPMAIFLAFQLSIIQVAAAVPKQVFKPVRVGYAGVQLDNIPPAFQDKIKRLLKSLINNNSYTYMGPEELRKIAPEEVDSLLLNPGKDEFRKLTNEENYDYLLSAFIKNISPKPNRVMLQGQIYRYDRGSDILNQSEVLCYIEDFENELSRVNMELIATIPRTQSAPKVKAILLIVVITIVVLSFTKTFDSLGKWLDTGDNGTSPPGEQD